MSFANRMLVLGGLAVLLLLVLAGIFASTLIANERKQQQWIDHSRMVVETIQALRYDTRTAESNARGFLVTGQEHELHAFNDAISAAQRDLSNFASLTGDNASQQIRVGILHTVLDGRIKILSHAIQLRKSGQFDLENTTNFAGAELIEQFGTITKAAMTEERKILANRQRDAGASQWRVGVALLAVGGAAFVFLAGFVFLLARSNTRLQTAEEIARHQIQVLQATLDRIRDGVGVFRGSGELIAFNATFFELMGFPVALARGDEHMATFRNHYKDRADILDILQPADADSPIHTQLKIGARELEVYRADIPEDGFLIAAVDITSRLRSETALRQAQKMEAVGQLTGGIAHDFNNLLQVVSANLDLMAKDVRGNPDLAGRAQTAMAAVERGARLTAQLLAFARRQALAPRATDVGRLLRGMTDLLRHTLGERVEIESSVAGGLWNTLIDPTQMENAVLNLAINARDAMDDDGKLTIEVANAFLDDNYAAEHDEVEPGQYVMVAVSDTGTGIAAEVLDRVFDPFFTTKAEGRGTGLGLSQVFGFVKQSGGHIKIYSEVGIGTTVKMYLPRTRKPEEATGPVDTLPVEQGSETILVVEDDEGVRVAVVDMLRELGYTVLKANNAEGAMAVLTSGAAVDLLFTDVVMPGPMRAPELARRAKELQPNIVVLYTSGYTQNAIVHNGRLDEGVFLLSKPYRKSELARKIRSLLDKAPPASQAASTPQTQTTAENVQVPEANTKTPNRVLIVEDDVIIRMSTVDMAEGLGLICTEAGNGADALERLENDESINILLTDLGLPGMKGRELVAEARKRRPDIKIVVASGYSGNDDETSDDPTIVFLGKPFDSTRLRAALTKAGVSI